MKYLLISLLGGLLGAAAALALLYVNPLTAGAPELDRAARWTLVYELPGTDPAVWTDGGLLGLPGRPAGIEQIWEQTIRRTGVGVYGLRAAPGEPPVAAATRISVPHPDSEFLLSGAILTDYWLLTIPGQGSLFLHLDNNVWPFIRQAWIPRYLDRAWQGPITYSGTAGPGAGGAGLLLGADGQFTGLRAAAHEQIELTAFDRQHQRVIGRLELDIAAPMLPAPSTSD